MVKAKKPVKAKPAKKVVASRTVKKSPAPKKAASVKKAPAKVNLSKVPAIKSKLTKSQIIASIAEHSGLSRKEIAAVFEGLNICIRGAIKGHGEIIVPEIGVKVRRLRKPATKKRTMISPFTGEEITVKAKPARDVIKVSALKALKESVS